MYRQPEPDDDVTPLPVSWEANTFDANGGGGYSYRKVMQVGALRS
jgi:hypothetical protein